MRFYGQTPTNFQPLQYLILLNLLNRVRCQQNLDIQIEHFSQLLTRWHRIKIHIEGPLTSEALKFLSSRMSHYACWPPFS